MKTRKPSIAIPLLTLALAGTPAVLAQNGPEHGAVPQTAPAASGSPAIPDAAPPTASPETRRAPVDPGPSTPASTISRTPVPSTQTAASDPFAQWLDSLPRRTQLSPWAQDVIKLTEAGIDEGVVLTFIDCSSTFDLGADQIIQLAQRGVAAHLINAMLQHDYEIATGLRVFAPSARPTPPPAIQPVFFARLDSETAAGESPSTSPGSRDPSNGVPAVETQASIPNRRAVVVSDFSELERLLNEMPPLHSAPAQPEHASAADLRLGLYPIREPHPVPITAPILVFRTAGRTPNLVLWESVSPAEPEQ